MLSSQPIRAKPIVGADRLDMPIIMYAGAFWEELPIEDFNKPEGIFARFPAYLKRIRRNIMSVPSVHVAKKD